MYTETKRLLTNRADAQKKYKAERTNIEKTIKDLFNYVQYFNSLDEYTSLVFNKSMSDILVIKELSHFIIPASVRIDSSDKGWTDLLIRDDKPAESDKLSLNDFYDLQMAFRGYFKRSMNEDTISLSEIKKHFNLTDVLPISSVSGKVWYKGVSFYPIKLKSNVSNLDRGYHYIVDENDVIQDFIATLSLT